MDSKVIASHILGSTIEHYGVKGMKRGVRKAVNKYLKSAGKMENGWSGRTLLNRKKTSLKSGSSERQLDGHAKNKIENDSKANDKTYNIKKTHLSNKLKPSRVIDFIRKRQRG